MRTGPPHAKVLVAAGEQELRQGPACNSGAGTESHGEGQPGFEEPGEESESRLCAVTDWDTAVQVRTDGRDNPATLSSVSEEVGSFTDTFLRRVREGCM